MLSSDEESSKPAEKRPCYDVVLTEMDHDKWAQSCEIGKTEEQLFMLGVFKILSYPWLRLMLQRILRGGQGSYLRRLVVPRNKFQTSCGGGQ